MDNSKALQNVAKQQVGAILLEQDCTAEIRFCRFERNSAFDSISVLKSNKAASVKIENSSFIENFATATMISVAGTEEFIV